ncbi:Trs120-domain-containing protein [Myriangium duriaei CBS 260.36]|uniref:Trs120-domain-containing protein n=1 Tax=Myriangium duriaei CBS 260.36 TaxID=1168546 RepID=A0A9P4J9F9_9PEZI|nr:Trs120-domain-containing protein [Myriangium duriaei CBS 260.36]
MGTDPFSPLAPARVRVLVLPFGKITNRRFKAFATRLQQVSSVRLGDITPDERPGRGTFSPLAFPDGRIHLDVSCSAPFAAYSELTSFEPFRSTMIILGTVDAREYRQASEQEESLVEDGSRNIFYQRAHDGFISAMENVQENYTGVLLTQLIIMDSEGPDPKPWIPEGSLHLPPEGQSTGTTLTGLMCDVVSRFLGEMAGLAEQMKTWASVATPLAGASQSQRHDSDRRPDFRRRLSELSQLSREGSPAADMQRPSSRQSSQAFHSPSPSVTGSPRPDSPSGRSDAASSPDLSSAETHTAADFYKPPPKYASMGFDPRKSRSIFPNALTGSSPEKERNIGRARVGITLGTLYLLAGRWADAWRELLEHTAKARSLNDYIWLAAGIERITMCMLLLGAEGFPFTIPSICFTGGERQSALPFMDSGRDTVTAIGPRDHTAANTALRTLGTSLGDIATTILAYYDRAGTFAGDHLQPLAFSEFVLRLCKLQLSPTSNFTSDEIFRQGKLDALRRPAGVKGPPEVSRLALCETTFRAYPNPFADFFPVGRTLVLAGVASVLSTLRMERKRAVVLKELINVMIPSLQQARRLGAAELGIHPSSSLSYANGMFITSNQDGNALSVRELLQQLQAAYAVRESTSDEKESTNATDQADVDFERLLDDVTYSIARVASLDELGSLNLKVSILRSSIDFCESLPDLSGVAQNAALLLKITGPQASVDPTRRDSYVMLAVDEQIRLANMIMTVTSLARERRVEIVEAPYWDKFLVRSVQLVEDDMTGKLLEHRKADISTSTKAGLFLHDAFAKKTEKRQQANIVVAEEPALVAVVLQNPYDFDIEVESINFVLEDGELEVDPTHVILGARRLQEVICLATAKTPGVLKIRACRIRMMGCREELLPIYNDEWRADQHVKFKEAVKALSLPQAVDRAVASQAEKLPKSSDVAITVIPAQPVVVVEKVNLRNQSLMLLEGERTSFSITLRNVSPNIDADFLHVSFEDSLTNALRTSLSSKTLSRMDLYEIELEMAQNPIFTWKRLDNGSDDIIKAGTCATFEISVLGKAGIRDARVFFDFAYLGAQREASIFYTRQLAVNINVSVNTCVEIQHFEVSRLSPISGHISEKVDDGDVSKGQCLLVVDVRNAWQHPVHVDLELQAEVCPQQYKGKDNAQVKTILSHQTARFVLPMHRLFVKASHAQIPWISSQSRRQFVVSTTADTATQQRAVRELFWYREELLKHLKGSWRDDATGRHGGINLRVININHLHLESLKLDDLDIQYDVAAQNGEKDSAVAKRTGGTSFEVKPRTFLSFRVSLANRSDRSIHAMLRMLPMVANQGPNSGAEMVSRRLVWSGVLQRPVPAIEPGQSRTVELGFCVLSAGMYNIGVVVEEIRPTLASEANTAKGEDINDDDDLDEAKNTHVEERRVWRAPELCLIRARNLA